MPTTGEETKVTKKKSRKVPVNKGTVEAANK